MIKAAKETHCFRVHLNLFLLALTLTCSLPLMAYGIGRALKKSVCPSEIQILHTNDLHSHFKPFKDPLSLGGVSRLKTKIDERRAEAKHSVLVDGGDFSEGDLYYNLGAGYETFRLLGSLGYEVAVVGNHDWLNGPDLLLKAFTDAKADNANPPALISSNLDASAYPNRSEFEASITPYIIKNFNGVRIAFVGVSTFEKIYDSFFKPIKIKDPLPILRELVQTILQPNQPLADYVVLVSHNSTAYNRKLLEALPQVELLIGGHDHELYVEPVRVSRKNGSEELPPGFIVEAGEWGKFLGEVKLSTRDAPLNSTSPCQVQFNSSRVHQIDKSISEDSEILDQVEALERKLELLHGPVFTTPSGHAEHEISRTSLENQMGNFVTDAFRNATRADIAIDQIPFIYTALPQGDLYLADIYRSLPGVYSPVTKKAWTISILPLKGKTLNWLIHFFLKNETLRTYGLPSVSGMEILFSEGNVNPESPPSLLLDILIDGKPIENDRTYTLAISGGVASALRYISSLIPNVIPIKEMVDTGIESWVAVAKYAAEISPLSSEKIQMGRLRHKKVDLRIWESDIQLVSAQKVSSKEVLVDLQITAHNNGDKDAALGLYSIEVFKNENGTQYDKPFSPKLIWKSQDSPELASGNQHTFRVRALLPLIDGVIPVYVEMSLNESITGLLSSSLEVSKQNPRIRLLKHFQYNSRMTKKSQLNGNH